MSSLDQSFLDIVVLKFDCMYLVQIHNMQHVMQHETINLKDEKQFIREIRQLRSLRDQLAVNMGTPEEIRKLIDDKEKNEERMRVRVSLFVILLLNIYHVVQVLKFLLTCIIIGDGDSRTGKAYINILVFRAIEWNR